MAYMNRMTQSNKNTNGLPFLKMHGLGNDFVIIDGRQHALTMTTALAQAIGDRHFGVGYDQLAVLTDADDADVNIAFWNSDGTTADACGNASRCIAHLIMTESKKDRITLRTGNGLLPARRGDGGMISVNMGQPVLDWSEIPLAQDADLNALPIDGAPSAVGMGNPHCVFFVDDADAIDLAAVGPDLEHHPLYPERTNVEFVHIIDRQNIRQRTWERGGMITYACGSGACAVAVAAHRKGLTDRAVTIHLDGGALQIDWRDDGVWMTGPVQLVQSGILAPEFLAQAT